MSVDELMEGDFFEDLSDKDENDEDEVVLEDDEFLDGVIKYI